MAQRVTPQEELEFLFKRIRDHTNELVAETQSVRASETSFKHNPNDSEALLLMTRADQGHALRIVVGEGLIAIAKAIEMRKL